MINGSCNVNLSHKPNLFPFFFLCSLSLFLVDLGISLEENIRGVKVNVYYQK